MHVLLVSTYELGRQPFGLASPAAWLERAGATVRCLDLAVEPADEEAIREAHLIAVYLPMHTATRIASGLWPSIRCLNPTAHLCAYGLYAPINEAHLREHGVDTILGGEFEAGLVSLYQQLSQDLSASATTGSGQVVSGPGRSEQQIPLVSLARQDFLVPQRRLLPVAGNYATLRTPDGGEKLVGYTEATRGCKHRCRHCPIVPVYDGVFRIVQPGVVAEDVRQQVESGVEHITFGDPDFFNGIGHAMRVVRDLRKLHPRLTYDVTIKVEHLLRHADHLEELRDTGCAFVTTAVESFDDRVLQLLDKGHSRDDVVRLIDLMCAVDLCLQPTFVAFHPWLSLSGYRSFLETLVELQLIDSIVPVQLAIRLLIPADSRLLELDGVEKDVLPFDPTALVHPWRHPDPAVDALQRELEESVAELVGQGCSRRQVFEAVWQRCHRRLGEATPSLPRVTPGRARATIPYLTEPWYC